jgi:hypothetical protein
MLTLREARGPSKSCVASNAMCQGRAARRTGDSEGLARMEARPIGAQALSAEGLSRQIVKQAVQLYSCTRRMAYVQLVLIASIILTSRQGRRGHARVATSVLCPRSGSDRRALPQRHIQGLAIADGCAVNCHKSCCCQGSSQAAERLLFGQTSSSPERTQEPCAVSDHRNRLAGLAAGHGGAPGPGGCAQSQTTPGRPPRRRSSSCSCPEPAHRQHMMGWCAERMLSELLTYLPLRLQP